MCPGDERQDDRWYRGMDEVVVQNEDIGDSGADHHAKAQQCADADRCREQQEDGG